MHAYSYCPLDGRGVNTTNWTDGASLALLLRRHSTTGVLFWRHRFIWGITYLKMLLLLD